MSDNPITIETEHPISISTRRPVSITSEGGTTTLRIEGVEVEPARRPSGLAAARPRTTPLDAEAPKADQAPRHGVLMPRSGKPCARVEGHKGACMSAEQVKRKQDYNKQRARERYAQDPDYAEKVRAQSRASHQRSKGGQPATE